MSINSAVPHVLVLPEDDANRQIANGFVLDSRVDGRRIQVLPPAHGWMKVLDCLCKDHVKGLQTYPNRRIILLIDFDDDVAKRSEYVKTQIPPACADRVFVLGVESEPESLRAACKKKFEPIGETLAEECAENTGDLWSHALLQHNALELARLTAHVKPFLFV